MCEGNSQNGHNGNAPFISFSPPPDSTLVGLALLTVKISKSHSDRQKDRHTHTHTHTRAGLLGTRDRTVAESSTWQNTTATTNNHDPGGIRTHNPSKREAANSRFRYRGYLYNEKQNGNAYRQTVAQFQWHHAKLLLDAPLDLNMPRDNYFFFFTFFVTCKNCRPTGCVSATYSARMSTFLTEQLLLPQNKFRLNSTQFHSLVINVHGMACWESTSFILWRFILAYLRCTYLLLFCCVCNAVSVVGHLAVDSVR